MSRRRAETQAGAGERELPESWQVALADFDVALQSIRLYKRPTVDQLRSTATALSLAVSAIDLPMTLDPSNQYEAGLSEHVASRVYAMARDCERPMAAVVSCVGMTIPWPDYEKASNYWWESDMLCATAALAAMSMSPTQYRRCRQALVEAHIDTQPLDLGYAGNPDANSDDLAALAAFEFRDWTFGRYIRLLVAANPHTPSAAVVTALAQAGGSDGTRWFLSRDNPESAYVADAAMENVMGYSGPRPAQFWRALLDPNCPALDWEITEERDEIFYYEWMEELAAAADSSPEIARLAGDHPWATIRAAVAD